LKESLTIQRNILALYASAGSVFDSLFDPEDRDDVFLRNIRLSPDFHGVTTQKTIVFGNIMTVGCILLFLCLYISSEYVRIFRELIKEF
jgi:hypothetical protein